MKGERVALTSAIMLGGSERRRSAKCAAGLEGCVEEEWEDGAIEVAVVSQRPGSCGLVGPGRMEMDVGTGIWREKVREGVRVRCAIREVDMLV